MHPQILHYTTNLSELLHPKKAFKKSGKLRRSFYEEELVKLHHELVKLQQWCIEEKKRILIIFEGIDTAGKSSSIKAINTYLNPRKARVVALPKPSDVELGQWYFQRHLKQLPNAEEMVFFDRSWYNRAGIEAVFGFCTKQQHELFYTQVGEVEEMLVKDEILLFKFYLTITKETQAKRIKDREQNPLKSWKLSRLDYEGHKRYDEYIRLRDKMFALSGTFFAPWCELDANDKKRARLNLIRYLLYNIDYKNKDEELICGVDEAIVTLHNAQM